MELHVRGPFGIHASEMLSASRRQERHPKLCPRFINELDEVE